MIDHYTLSNCPCGLQTQIYYSRTPVTQTLKGNEKLFELAGFRVIGVDENIQFSRLIINSLLIFITSVYNTMEIKLTSRETNTFCNNCNDYPFLRQCNTVNVSSNLVY